MMDVQNYNIIVYNRWNFEIANVQQEMIKYILECLDNDRQVYLQHKDSYSTLVSILFYIYL